MITQAFALMVALALPSGTSNAGSIPGQARSANIDLTSGVLSIEGELSPTLLAALESRVPWDRVQNVKVSSSGGEIGASIRIARLLASKHKRIRVTNLCASACFNIMVIPGVEVDPGTLVMLHQTRLGQYEVIRRRYPQLSAGERVAAMDDADWLRKNGVDPTILLMAEASLLPQCVHADHDTPAASGSLVSYNRFDLWAPRDTTLRRLGLRVGPNWHQTRALVLQALHDRFPSADARQLQAANEPEKLQTYATLSDALGNTPVCH